MALDFYYFKEDILTCLPNNSDDTKTRILIDLKDIIENTYNEEQECNCDIAFLLTVKSDLNTSFDKYKQVSESFIDIPLITIGAYPLSEIETYLPLNFYDSSIWNYYIGLKGEKKISEKIKAVLKIVCNNYSNGLYQANVSKEFRKFNYRILGQSYLDKVGGSSHATFISPFVFHSESNIKKLAEGELSKFKKTNLKWRFLLIDDFAKKKLSGEGTKTKFDYIKNIIKRDFNIDKKNSGQIKNNTDNDISVEIDKATNIDEAIKKISEKTYDIILLDYLLEEKENGRREYGDKFIEEIKNAINSNEENTQNAEENEEKNSKKEVPEFVNKIGPLNRFWIFPISSFSTAMIEKIRERGIGHLHKYWYIPRGADPINTPELFRYNLFRFMNLQIEELLNYNNIKFDFSEDYLIYIIEELYKTYKKKNEKKTDKFAVKIYPELILIHSKLQELRNDKKNGSLFAKSVLDKYYKPAQKKLWQHILHLFYLLSSHGYLKSPEMWKELNSIKQTADNTENLKKQKWYKIVNKYIAELYNKIS